MKKSTKLIPKSNTLNIFLAEDDSADCELFKDALEELQIAVKLTIFKDGEQLLKQFAKKNNRLPDVLFLDLNMPRKNGFATLGAIKRNSKLDQIPVVILTSSPEEYSVDQVFNDAAHYYIRKPTEFTKLKNVISNALSLTLQENKPLPGKDNFILKGDL